MSEITRHIGLSLGADICWPIAYQEIMKRLDLRIPIGEDVLRFEVERVTIEPFDLRQPCKYDLVIDRLTHWYHTTREWIKKAVILDDLYVFNNPWSVQSMQKHTTYCAMIRLGLPIPETWLVPPKEYDPADDLHVTLQRYARLFDLGAIGRALGYPLFMKPYDGGGWKAVSRIDTEDALRAAYEQSGKYVMHLQESVDPSDLFVRCIGLGPQVRIIAYDASAPLHDRYTTRHGFLSAAEGRMLENMALTINTFFGWDFNSSEAMRGARGWMPIDFANPCPDSQVTSLHYHFPWLIQANIRWSVFAAASRRPMRVGLDWQPYFDACEEGMTLEERLEACAAIARERLDAASFEEFCATHLPHLEETALEFFGSDMARDAVRQKVSALYPAHEVDRFTDVFWRRIQDWRRDATAAREAAVGRTPATDERAADQSTVAPRPATP